MRSDEKHSSGKLREPRIHVFHGSGQDSVDRIDDCIPRHDDARFGDSFRTKIRGRAIGRGKIQVRNGRNQAPVHFFGERPELVAGAESGFDVGYANFFLEPHERSGKCGRRIALHEKPIRADFAKHVRKRFEYASGEFERGLVFLHQIQIVVGRDAKNTQHLIEQVAMLRGYTNMRFDMLSARGADDRRHLDGFGTRTENSDDAHELFACCGSQKRVRDAIGQNRPIVRLHKTIPIGLPSQRARLHERVRPRGGVWLREKYIRPGEPLPRLQRIGNNQFSAGGIFYDLDLEREVSTRGDALGEDADVESVEVRRDFRRRNSASCDYIVFAICLEQRLPAMGRSDDEEFGVRKTLARCEKCFDHEVDSGERPVIADVADDKFSFEAEPGAQGSYFFVGHAAKFCEISSVRKRLRQDVTFARELFAEWLGDGKDGVHIQGNFAEIRTNFFEALRRLFVFREPIDDIEGSADVLGAIGPEELGCVENMRDFVCLNNGEQSAAISGLASSKRASRTEKTMQQYRLPNGELDGREAANGRGSLLRVKRGRNSNAKLFDAANERRLGIDMQRVSPLQNINVETIGETLREFELANGNVVCIDVRNDEKARFLRRRRSGRRRGHFSTRKWPMTSASIPEEKNVRIASVGVWTMASPRRLKLVFMMTGTPVIFPNSSMSR